MLIKHPNPALPQFVNMKVLIWLIQYWCAANYGKIGERRPAISIFWDMPSRTSRKCP
jgi:hypothetical protein